MGSSFTSNNINDLNHRAAKRYVFGEYAEFFLDVAYKVPSLVEGSDGLVYNNLTVDNLGNNPVTDGGINWEEVSVGSGVDAPITDFYTDSGTANVYVLTAASGTVVPSEYRDGMEVNFIPDNNGTGSATVNIESIGLKDIKLLGGNNPASGDISGRIKIIYDEGNDVFELHQTTFTDLNLSLKTQVSSAWVSFVGTGTVSIRDSFNVSSITDFGTGDYQANFSSDLKDANYAYTASIKADNNAPESKAMHNKNNGAYSVSALRVVATFSNDLGTGAIDAPIGNIIILGGV